MAFQAFVFLHFTLIYCCLFMLALSTYCHPIETRRSFTTCWSTSVDFNRTSHTACNNFLTTQKSRKEGFTHHAVSFWTLNVAENQEIFSFFSLLFSFYTLIRLVKKQRNSNWPFWCPNVTTDSKKNWILTHKCQAIYAKNSFWTEKGVLIENEMCNSASCQSGVSCVTSTVSLSLFLSNAMFHLMIFQPAY